MRKFSPFLATMLFVVLSLTIWAKDKDKKKQELPDAVLNATTAAVLIDPDAGASVTNPRENDQARQAVERALEKWGRFRVLWTDTPESTDLIITVRKGGDGARPVLRGGPINERLPGIDVGENRTSIGVGQIGNRYPEDRVGAGAEYNLAGDTMAVYISGIETPIWRYSGKKALDAPSVRAVEEFKKAITRSEEARRTRKP